MIVHMLRWWIAVTFTAAYIAVMSLCSALTEFLRFPAEVHGWLHKWPPPTVQVIANVMPMPWFGWVTSIAVLLLFLSDRSGKDRLLQRSVWATMCVPVAGSAMVAYSLLNERWTFFVEKNPPSSASLVANICATGLVYFLAVVIVNRREKQQPVREGSLATGETGEQRDGPLTK